MRTNLVWRTKVSESNIKLAIRVLTLLGVLYCAFLLGAIEDEIDRLIEVVEQSGRDFSNEFDPDDFR